MRLPELDITLQNHGEVADKLKVLSNKLHLRILLILEEGPKTNEEIFRILLHEGIVKFPASSYKSLEKLVHWNFIKKEYISYNRTFSYSI